MKTDKWKTISLLLILFLLSLLKDDLTPDYRNTSAALFLSPENLKGASRVATILSHGAFWAKAFLYTGCFVLLPPAIVHFAFRQPALTRFTLYLHLGAATCLYVGVFLNLAIIDHILVSKVNRYLHSPIITLFLWAAFTLTNKKTSL